MLALFRLPPIFSERSGETGPQEYEPLADIVTTGTVSAAPPSGASNTAASSEGSASSAASAIETPAGTPSETAAPAPATGEPPQERWSDILDNARKKTRGEVEAEFRQKYGWADQFQTDPYTFVDAWVDQLAEHPQYQPQILAKAARLLASRRGQTQPVEDLKADVPIVDANGNVTGYTYRGDVLDKILDRRLKERFEPLEQQAKVQQQREQLAELQQHTWAQANDTLTQLRQNPYFKDHEAKVKAALAAHEEWGDNIHAAFNHVLVTDILPTLSQHEQRKVVESLQQKASASTVGPSGTGAATPKKFKSHAEALRYYSEHPEEAEAMAHR